jgi:hypothetical protein
MDELQQRISLRAYEIWEREGRPHGHASDHWLEAERQLAHEDGATASSGVNEGEGSRTGARAYDQAATAFARSGQVEAAAREAAAAIDGPEGAALRQAEEAGRRHSHGEDPALLSGERVAARP